MPETQRGGNSFQRGREAKDLLQTFLYILMIGIMSLPSVTLRMKSAVQLTVTVLDAS